MKSQWNKLCECGGTTTLEHDTNTDQTREVGRTDCVCDPNKLILELRNELVKLIDDFEIQDEDIEKLISNTDIMDSNQQLIAQIRQKKHDVTKILDRLSILRHELKDLPNLDELGEVTLRTSRHIIIVTDDMDKANHKLLPCMDWNLYRADGKGFVLGKLIDGDDEPTTITVLDKESVYDEVSARRTR